MKDNFYSFNEYLKNIFGERVQRISINAGFRCPNIDGTLSSDGCIYCNNKSFGIYIDSNKSIEDQIMDSIAFYKKRLGANKFIAYFQSFSNTYSNLKTLRRTYDIIKKFPEIVGLFISTRPDSVDEEKIRLISEYQKKYLVWIEYGLQTTHDKILKLINRNHTYQDFLGALDLTRKYKINVGIHMILGLPFMTHDDMILDAERIAKLDVQGVKFHVLKAVKGTKLEDLYHKNKISVLSKEDYIRLVCDFLERLPGSAVILRIISSSSPEYLIAPLWVTQKAQIIDEIKKELQRRKTFQGSCYEGSSYKG